MSKTAGNIGLLPWLCAALAACFDKLSRSGLRTFTRFDVRHGSKPCTLHAIIMRHFILIAFLLIATYSALSQTTKFDSLSDEMFFNIFINKPDSSVFDFVKKYFPGFTKPYEPGHWTLYPPNPPELQYTIHSLKFTKHPYFKAKFREGRLDLFASEEKGGPPGVIDFQEWFMFDNKTDAQNAFAILARMFESVSKSKNVFQRNGKTVAEYSDQPILNDANSVQFILTKDELQDDKYKIFFRLGSFTYSK